MPNALASFAWASPSLLASRRPHSRCASSAVPPLATRVDELFLRHRAVSVFIERDIHPRVAPPPSTAPHVAAAADRRPPLRRRLLLVVVVTAAAVGAAGGGGWVEAGGRETAASSVCDSDVRAVRCL